jgi:hypothetical protein
VTRHQQSALELSLKIDDFLNNEKATPETIFFILIVFKMLCLLHFVLSDYQFKIDDGELVGVTGDGSSITIPSSVIGIARNVFIGIPATRLRFENGFLISSLNPLVFNGSSFTELLFHLHIQQQIQIYFDTFQSSMWLIFQDLLILFKSMLLTVALN